MTVKQLDKGLDLKKIQIKCYEAKEYANSGYTAAYGKKWDLRNNYGNSIIHIENRFSQE